MLDLPIKEHYAPNIYVSVSAIFNDELYTDSKNIIIPPTDKFVNVAVTSDKAVYEPQEKGTFTIKTTDAKGKPVTAEVSLGIVDDAIYAIAPEQVDEIQKYFYSLRYHSVDTSSSLYFRFYGYSHRKGAPVGAARKGDEACRLQGRQPRRADDPQGFQGHDVLVAHHHHRQGRHGDDHGRLSRIT